MDCLYCTMYQESPTRIGKGSTETRFCNHLQKMIFPTQKICEDGGFEPHRFFWCDNSNARIDLVVCPARQKREMQECSKCKQKKIILEIRKIIGIRSRKTGGMRPLIKKKERHEEIKEHVEEAAKEAQTQNEVVVAEQKPKIILHKKEPENKPKITLHKRIKEEPKPIKLIKRKG